jgi:hypothetical protein
MSKQQSASKMAADQMFADMGFWDDVESHLQKRQPETIDNARVKPITDQSSGLAAASIRPAE